MFVVEGRQNNQVRPPSSGPRLVEAELTAPDVERARWDDDRILALTRREVAESGPASAIPDDLDRMAPGVVLAGILSQIDLSCLSAHDRVVVLRAHARMASHYRARTYGDTAAVAHHMDQEFPDDLELAHKAAAAEIRVALHLTRRAADVELDLAPLCRHDHRIRHQTGWTHQPQPDGTHQWTTHLDHTYTTTRPP